MDARATALLSHAAELERRDLATAALLETVEALARRVGALRGAVAELVAARGALPALLESAHEAERGARAAEADARTALAGAEERSASLGRRARRAERDQAERELARAREEAHDAQVRAARAAARVGALEDEGRVRAAEADRLRSDAAALAGEIRACARVSDAGKGDPGATLASIEEWGARARAALFVAQGTLAAERERVVLEANALGASVLGEPLGGSSASLVRRRVEDALADRRSDG